MFSAQQTPCGQDPPSDDTRPGDWREQRLRSFADLEPVLTAVLADLAGAGYLEKDQFAVRLALDEALANGIKHGNREDPARAVTLRYRVLPDSLMAEVEDEGPGFDPDQVADPLAAENLDRPSGRGLFLIRAYMTWVRHNDRGNRVTLCKYRSRS
jgi:serine/threonine-protein kinase RsbW